MVHSVDRVCDHTLCTAYDLSRSVWSLSGGELFISGATGGNPSDEYKVNVSMFGSCPGSCYDHLRNDRISVLFVGEWFGPVVTCVYLFCPV